MYADLNYICGSKKANEHVYGKEITQLIYNLNGNSIMLRLNVKVADGIPGNAVRTGSKVGKTTRAGFKFDD